MAQKVTLVFDFACPYCFWLEEMLERLPVRPELEYLPFQLTARPQPRQDVYSDPARRAKYAADLAPACRDQGVKMCLPPKVIPRPYTDLAFRGWYLAAERGKGLDFYQQVFRAYFQQERDIGEPDVLCGLAERAGLSADELRPALEEGPWAERLHSDLDRVSRMDIRVVPTLIAGKSRLEGFVPDPQALEAWLRQVAAGD